MAADKGVLENDEFVYRISTSEEWEDLQRSEATFGGDIDKSTGCIHLSRLHQLGKGLVYEAVGNSDVFPHFYGPSRSFSPLPLDAITKTEKLILCDGKFSCSLLN